MIKPSPNFRTAGSEYDQRKADLFATHERKGFAAALIEEALSSLEEKGWQGLFEEWLLPLSYDAFPDGARGLIPPESHPYCAALCQLCGLLDYAGSFLNEARSVAFPLLDPLSIDENGYYLRTGPNDIPAETVRHLVEKHSEGLKSVVPFMPELRASYLAARPNVCWPLLPEPLVTSPPLGGVPAQIYAENCRRLSAAADALCLDKTNGAGRPVALLVPRSKKGIELSRTEPALPLFAILPPEPPALPEPVALDLTCKLFTAGVADKDDEPVLQSVAYSVDITPKGECLRNAAAHAIQLLKDASSIDKETAVIMRRYLTDKAFEYMAIAPSYVGGELSADIVEDAATLQALSFVEYNSSMVGKSSVRNLINRHRMLSDGRIKGVEAISPASASYLTDFLSGESNMGMFNVHCLLSLPGDTEPVCLFGRGLVSSIRFERNKNAAAFFSLLLEISDAAVKPGDAFGEATGIPSIFHDSNATLIFRVRDGYALHAAVLCARMALNIPFPGLESLQDAESAKIKAFLLPFLEAYGTPESELDVLLSDKEFYSWSSGISRIRRLTDRADAISLVLTGERFDYSVSDSPYFKRVLPDGLTAENMSPFCPPLADGLPPDRGVPPPPPKAVPNAPIIRPFEMQPFEEAPKERMKRMREFDARIRKEAFDLMTGDVACTEFVFTPKIKAEPRGFILYSAIKTLQDVFKTTFQKDNLLSDARMIPLMASGGIRLTPDVPLRNRGHDGAFSYLFEDLYQKTPSFFFDEEKTEQTLRILRDLMNHSMLSFVSYIEEREGHNVWAFYEDSKRIGSQRVPFYLGLKTEVKWHQEIQYHITCKEGMDEDTVRFRNLKIIEIIFAEIAAIGGFKLLQADVEETAELLGNAKTCSVFIKPPTRVENVVWSNRLFYPALNEEQLLAAAEVFEKGGLIKTWGGAFLSESASRMQNILEADSKFDDSGY